MLSTPEHQQYPQLVTVTNTTTDQRMFQSWTSYDYDYNGDTHGHGHSHSESSSPIVINAPSPMSLDENTFAWSDFPVVQRDSPYFFCKCATSATTTTTSTTTSPLHEQGVLEMELETCESDSDSSTASTWSETSSSSSSSISSLESKKGASHHLKKTLSKKDRKHRLKVSFSPQLQVRTHSVVLGEHPCCGQLALELGWEHNDKVLVNLEVHESSKLYKNKHNPRGEARRRSYFERKQILKEVTGLTDSEIRQTTLQRAAPSSTDLMQMQQQRIH